MQIATKWFLGTDGSKGSWTVLCGGLILEFGEEVVEGFGEGGMGEDSVAQRGVGKLAHHGDLELGHDFTAFETEDGGAENLVGVRVDNGFHEAAGFVDFESARDVI